MKEARKWLERARAMKRELKALKAARESTFEMLTSITQNYNSDGAQSTKDPHKFDSLVELNHLINQKEDEINEARLEITRAILQVPSGNQRAVLLNYYVAGEKLEKIAEENGCSTRNVQNVRKRGVIWIEKNIADVPCISTMN